jgi:trehalose/maltose hydrolase-like predicted phosphorylase
MASSSAAQSCIGRTVDAVILDREHVMSRLDRVRARDVRRAANRLREQGVEVVVLDTTDRVALQAELDKLAAVGITGELVLVLRAGPELVSGLLAEQVRRRRARRVPGIDEDVRWTVYASDAGTADAVLTIGAGGIGTRGNREEAAGAVAPAMPLLLASGIYCGSGSAEHLLPGPAWTDLDIAPPVVRDERILDLRSGVLLRTESTPGPSPLKSMRFMSVARPGVVALRAEAAVGRLRPGRALRPAATESSTAGQVDGRWWAQSTGNSGGIGAVARQRIGRDGAIRTVQRLAAYVIAPQRPKLSSAQELLDEAERLGFDRLLGEQRAAWAGRWRDAGVEIPDDRAAELAIRFALFQLWSNADRRGEQGLGARGVSGPGYSGHVFWDSDVFVLPALATMDPAAAAAMLQYRVRRLAAARAAARTEGRSGARFPWESASSGADVTPATGAIGGQPVDILTGRFEEHITADVAWSAVHLARWCGEPAGGTAPVRELLVETASYWSSRVRLDAAGAAHLDGVIGPDEYHELVDDNAFTNVLARWNLRTAAALNPAHADAANWRELADRLVDGYDPETGRYEQFAGYYRLEPLRVADFAVAPVAIDVLLGRERVAGSQLIKQPDVLMLHHLVPDEVAAGSLIPNLDYYEPRTAHGSSLSPAISAALLARAGRPDEALALLRVALRLDLDDLTGSTSSGLHMATFGGVWQALVFGFLGARVDSGALTLDPCLPSGWHTVTVRMRCLRRRVRVRVADGRVEVGTDGPLAVRLLGGPPVRVNGVAALVPAPRAEVRR